MRLALILALASALLLPASAASTQSAYRFSFSAYANNVKVVKPLVGKWQLGVAEIRGSGTAGDTVTVGTFLDEDDPMLPQYEARWLRAKAVTWASKQQILAHGKGTITTLTVIVEITSSSHPNDECAPGLTGKLTLVDSTAKIANGENGDTVLLGSWSGKCNTHVHGWTNQDGGARTSPRYGGPGGGQWAVVKVTKS
jgi:hypothetical protein